MILEELIIYSYAEKKVLKHYKFNKFGINIILGERRLSEEETNGVGKTTMVECIEFLLGKNISKSYTSNSLITQKDILLVLKVNINNNVLQLGRFMNQPNIGLIQHSPKLSYNKENWDEYPVKEYKRKIHELVLGQDDIPISFSGLREYIMRDEKQGFNNIILVGRDAMKSHMYLSYLFGIPYDSELKIIKYKKEIEKSKQQIKIIESTGTKIEELKMKEEQLKKKITNLDEVIKSVDVTEQFKRDSIKYSNVKNSLNKIQKEIFEIEHVCKQYEKNINNLEEKTKGIKELKDVKPFFEQLLNYFPNNIQKNFDEIEEFYEFMVENRGNYFNGKIQTLKAKLQKLYADRKELEAELNKSSQLFKSDKFIEDISVIVKEREEKQIELAEVKVRIADYNKKNEINNRINELEFEKLRLTSIMNDKFNSYEKYLQWLDDIFNQLVAETYNQVGVLSFEHENSARGNAATGRVKISCSIPDENSHGRLYMKINMFDLTWLFSRVDKGLPINFLFHDGSYAKPAPKVKSKLLFYVDFMLKQYNKGQYFVTINVDELLPDDLETLARNNSIVAKLNRSNGDENRFFGFRY